MKTIPATAILLNILGLLCWAAACYVVWNGSSRPPILGAIDSAAQLAAANAAFETARMASILLGIILAMGGTFWLALGAIITQLDTIHDALRSKEQPPRA